MRKVIVNSESPGAASQARRDGHGAELLILNSWGFFVGFGFGWFFFSSEMWWQLFFSSGMNPKDLEWLDW